MMRAAAYRFLSALMPALGFFLCLVVIYNFEARYNPIVTNWSLDSVEVRGDSYVVSGRLTKNRACELLSTSIVAVPKDDGPRSIIYQLHPDDQILGGDGPRGTSTWGPWSVPIPAPLIQHRAAIDRLEIIGTHRCHALWVQETMYGSIPIERLPQ